MKSRTAFVAVTAVIFGLAAPVSEAHAQEGWFFDIEGGLVLPLGDMADVLNAGPTFGAAVGQEFENVGVGVSFDVDLLPGKEQEDMTEVGANFYRYHIFGEYAFFDPRRSKNALNLIMSAGGTTMSTDEISSLGEGVSATFFSFETGLHAGTGRVFLEATWGALFAESNRTNEAWLRGFGTVSNITFKAGLRL